MTQDSLTGKQVAALVRLQPFYKELRAELRRNEGDIDPEHSKRGYSHFIEALPAMRVLRSLEAAPDGAPESLVVAARVFAVWYEHDYDFLPRREHGFREYFKGRPLRFLFDRLAEVSGAATRDGEQQADAYLQLVHVVETGDTLRWIAPERLPAPASYILKRDYPTDGPVHCIRHVLERDGQDTILSSEEVDAFMGYSDLSMTLMSQMPQAPATVWRAFRGYNDLAMALEHVRILNGHAVQEAYWHLHQLVTPESTIRVDELHVFGECDRLLTFVVVRPNGTQHDIDVVASRIFEMPLEEVPGKPGVFALRARDLGKQTGLTLGEILLLRLSRRTLERSTT